MTKDETLVKLLELMHEVSEVSAVFNGEFIETEVNFEEIAQHLVENGVVFKNEPSGCSHNLAI